MLFPFEKSKEHSLENCWRDNTFLVINQFVKLLPQVVEYAQIKVLPVDLLDDFNPVFALPIL